jgi:hypothetical protein
MLRVIVCLLQQERVQKGTASVPPVLARSAVPDAPQSRNATGTIVFIYSARVRVQSMDQLYVRPMRASCPDASIAKARVILADESCSCAVRGEGPWAKSTVTGGGGTTPYSTVP